MVQILVATKKNPFVCNPKRQCARAPAAPVVLVVGLGPPIRVVAVVATP